MRLMAVLVTGICGRLGRLVTRELHRKTSVVGIDRREFEDRPKDVVHHRVDIRRKKVRDVLRSGEVDMLVHLGTMHNPRSSDDERHSWNVVGLQNLLDYAVQYRVKKVVVLSSANVYGPRPENPQFLTEDAPLLGAARYSAIRDLMEAPRHRDGRLEAVQHRGPRAQRREQLLALRDAHHGARLRSDGAAHSRARCGARHLARARTR
jgi:nucleoside-diphosphate-sugar epimerase